jgi:predicted RNase H-like nuclease (RuvC/YqgF family)
MDPSSVTAIAVALISVLSAWLAGRAARNAAKFSADASTSNEKVKAETEAYNRARAIDVATIERQDREITELREEIESLKAAKGSLERQNEALRKRVSSLERRKPNG